MDDAADIALYLVGLVVAGLCGAFVIGIGQQLAAFVWDKLTATDDHAGAIDDLNERTRAGFESAQRAIDKLEERIGEMEGE